MIHANVVIGRRVKIWHNVTLAVQASTGAPQKIIVEEDVIVGANAVVVTPRNGGVRIGKGARIGAGRSRRRTSRRARRSSALRCA
jgi:serine acetyltransferase